MFAISIYTYKTCNFCILQVSKAMAKNSIWKVFVQFALIKLLFAVQGCVI
jgi:hypothetical protein